MAKRKQDTPVPEVATEPPQAAEPNQLFEPMSVAESLAAEIVPDMADPEWDAYVMAQFVPEELVNGKPRVTGLRRVVRKLLGPIRSTESTVVAAPEYSRERYEDIGGWSPAIVETTLHLFWRRNLDEDDHPHEAIFSDVAEVWRDTCPDPNFHRFMVSCAATRSEARALRKALQLRTCSADEMVEPVQAGEKGIDDLQVRWINSACRDNDINVKKFVNGGKSGNVFRRIGDVSNDVAAQMIAVLNGYGTDPSTIPGKILGYDPEWEKSFR